MVYSFARVGAVVNMKVDDYYQNGKRFWFRLHEKGGKHHEVPVTIGPRSLCTPTWPPPVLPREEQSPLPQAQPPSPIHFAADHSTIFSAW